MLNALQLEKYKFCFANSNVELTEFEITARHHMIEHLTHHLLLLYTNEVSFDYFNKYFENKVGFITV